MRIGIASIIQETNTFSASPSTLEDFTIVTGEDLPGAVAGTNSELSGALRALEEGNTTAVPLLRLGNALWAARRGYLPGAATSIG